MEQDVDDLDQESGPLQAVVPSHQSTLFPELTSQVPGEDVGFRGPSACAAAGITYRQLDYWARTDLVAPSIRSASGSGSARLYSFRDIVVLRVVKKLLDAGVSLQNVRAAVAHVRGRGVADLAQLTLVSDGSTVYEVTSADELVDVVRGGQGVLTFVPVSRSFHEVECSIAAFPAERAEAAAPTGPSVPSGESTDELAVRRQRRTAS
jgi:DNA-binding transcriptional MerR regulator